MPLRVHLAPLAIDSAHAIDVSEGFTYLLQYELIMFLLFGNKYNKVVGFSYPVTQFHCMKRLQLAKSFHLKLLLL